MAKRYGRSEQQRSTKPAAQLRLAGWVNSITSAGSATVLLAGLALGAVLERAILDNLDDGPAQPEPGDGRIQVRPGSAPDPAQSNDNPAPSPALSLASQVERLTLDQRGRQAKQTYRSKDTGKPIVRVSRASRDRTSAMGTSVIPIPRGSSAMPEATLFVGKKTAGRWDIALSGTRSFQNLLEQMPDSLISSGERLLLTAFNNGAARSKRADTALSLPWKVDEPWSLQSDVADSAKSGGPQSFVGFSRKGGEVLAAGGGRLYRLCGDSAGRGMIMVVHPNGLATQYYQMSDVTARKDGSVVQRGDLLGNVGTDRPCGGVAADRPQVWFGVRDANGAVSLDGKEIGGWRFTESKNASGITALRGARRIVAGKALPNLGSVPVLPLPGSSESPGSVGETETPGAESGQSSTPARVPVNGSET